MQRLRETRHLTGRILLRLEMLIRWQSVLIQLMALCFPVGSDCWFHLGQGESALTDAKACKRLGQDLTKAYYREGAALRLLQKFEEAANAFYRGIQIDPNEELITALQGTVAERDAAKQFHDMELELSCVSYKS